MDDISTEHFAAFWRWRSWYDPDQMLNILETVYAYACAYDMEVVQYGAVPAATFASASQS